MVVNGKLVSRTLKPIPNQEIRNALERPEFEGFDGELIVGDGTNFQATTSFVTAPNKTGENWSYMVFDLWNHTGTNIDRAVDLAIQVAEARNPLIVQVPSLMAETTAELEEFEAVCLKQGLEGVIARIPDARYKFGRSSPLKGPLFKIKRFIDFEAEVIGVYEEMENQNEATTNALGRTERSTAKAGLVGKGRLGGLYLRAINGPAAGVEFKCGTGFTADQRQYYWDGCNETDTDYPVGMIAKIKSFPIGVKDKPRFPVWLGFRDMEIDG
jgi:DNA ligase-1